MLMNATKYIYERNRLTENCNIKCVECRLYNKSRLEKGEGYCFKDETMSVAIVEQWSKDCPAETVLSELTKRYPNHEVNVDTLIPTICPSVLNKDYTDKCKGNRGREYLSCKECWNQPVIKE